MKNLFNLLTTSKKSERKISEDNLMVLIGIGKDIALKFALKVTVNVVGMIKYAEPNHQKN